MQQFIILCRTVQSLSFVFQHSSLITASVEFTKDLPIALYMIFQLFPISLFLFEESFHGFSSYRTIKCVMYSLSNIASISHNLHMQCMLQVPLPLQIFSPFQYMREFTRSRDLSYWIYHIACSHCN